MNSPCFVGQSGAPVQQNVRLPTLTPFADTFKGLPTASYYSAAKEQKRQAVNKWIRESDAFDAVVDLRLAVRTGDGRAVGGEVQRRFGVAACDLDRRGAAFARSRELQLIR